MYRSGFNLRKWNSNNKVLDDAINSAEKSRTEPSISNEAEFTQEDEWYVKATLGSSDQQDNNSIKVLSINWNCIRQQIRRVPNFMELINLARSLSVTKHSVLRLRAKIFDPLGLLSAFVIQIKILFQELCTQNINWDQDICGTTLGKLNLLLTELESLRQVNIPRC